MAKSYYITEMQLKGKPSINQLWTYIQKQCPYLKAYTADMIERALIQNDSSDFWSAYDQESKKDIYAGMMISGRVIQFDIPVLQWNMRIEYRQGMIDIHIYMKSINAVNLEFFLQKPVIHKCGYVESITVYSKPSRESETRKIMKEKYPNIGHWYTSLFF